MSTNLNLLVSDTYQHIRPMRRLPQQVVFVMALMAVLMMVLASCGAKQKNNLNTATDALNQATQHIRTLNDHLAENIDTSSLSEWMGVLSQQDMAQLQHLVQTCLQTQNDCQKLQQQMHTDWHEGGEIIGLEAYENAQVSLGDALDELHVHTQNINRYYKALPSLIREQRLDIAQLIDQLNYLQGAKLPDEPANP